MFHPERFQIQNQISKRKSLVDLKNHSYQRIFVNLFIMLKLGAYKLEAHLRLPNIILSLKDFKSPPELKIFEIFILFLYERKLHKSLSLQWSFFHYKDNIFKRQYLYST